MPQAWFRRQDESADEAFYASPRLVAHIDQSTIDALTAFYTKFIPPGADVLDLMSSWISHLPEQLTPGRVAGLGMNADELAANPRLDDWCVHNLNETPALPYPDQTFDRALIAVSIQYLTQPVEVMKSICAKLKPGGQICIAMSHRLFPTKAIAAFTQMPPRERINLVAHYLQSAGFEKVEFFDRSPERGDPLWLVTGVTTDEELSA
ncbi:MAG: methyltransferase domain-containing protein [Proteobacteria bacterium]|nr:methyltransferase domain-containing protein [Pseudomonadota bacterium]